MLVKVTTQCPAGCTHCLEDARPVGEHMSVETFGAVLDFIQTVEGESLGLLGASAPVLLSGGECTENPLLPAFIRMVQDRELMPVLLTNGLWLEDAAKRRELLPPGEPSPLVQVSYDSRYYQREPPRIDDRRVIYCWEETGPLTTLGRGKTGGALGHTPRRSPTSFNFRASVRASQNFAVAVMMMRLQALAGRLWGHCSPSISAQGGVHLGESCLCYQVGTVWDSVETLTQNTLAMKGCNRCRLEDNLTPLERGAIGLPLA
jgi:hypothetical protein